MGNQNDSLNDVKPDNNQQNIIYANQNVNHLKILLKMMNAFLNVQL